MIFPIFIYQFFLAHCVVVLQCAEYLLFLPFTLVLCSTILFRLGESSKEKMHQDYMTDILEKISATQPNSKQRCVCVCVACGDHMARLITLDLGSGPGAVPVDRVLYFHCLSSCSCKQQPHSGRVSTALGHG